MSILGISSVEPAGGASVSIIAASAMTASAAITSTVVASAATASAVVGTAAPSVDAVDGISSPPEVKAKPAMSSSAIRDLASAATSSPALASAFASSPRSSEDEESQELPQGTFFESFLSLSLREREMQRAMIIRVRRKLRLAAAGVIVAFLNSDNNVICNDERRSVAMEFSFTVDSYFIEITSCISLYISKRKYLSSFHMQL